MDQLAVGPLSGTVARLAPLSAKVTDPVGTTDAAEVTVAVKVTCWPKDDGLVSEARPVVVLAGTTVRLVP